MSYEEIMSLLVHAKDELERADGGSFQLEVTRCAVEQAIAQLAATPEYASETL